MVRCALRSRAMHEIAMIVQIAPVALIGGRASGSRAHGGPPSAVGIAAANDAGPTLVVVNEGLALRRDGGWSFLCPRLWGDADTGSGKLPLALSADGRASYIVGQDDLYVARDGVIAKQDRPELSRAAVIGLAGDPDGLYVLRIGPEGSAVVRIDAAEPQALFDSSEFWSALAVDGDRLHLARPTIEGALAFATLDRSGAVRAEFEVKLERAPAQLRLRTSAGRVFAVVFDGERYAMGALDGERWELVAQSAGPIDGPVTTPDGTAWIAADGELLRAGEGGFEAAGEARRVSCLGAWGSFVYACIGSDLYRLGEGGLGDALFELHGFAAPEPELVPEPLAYECDLQWRLFENDLQRVGLEPRGAVTAADAGVDAGRPVADASPDPSPPRSTGCSAAVGRARASWASWLVWLAALSCRSWRARACGRRSGSCRSSGGTRG